MTIDTVEVDNPQPGDDVVVDTISAQMYQVVKLAYGAEGTANLVGSTSSNPLPVETAPPSTGATELAKAVDAAAGGSDVGIANLVVRDDALTTLTPVDGDYVQQRCDSQGSTWVRLSDTDNTVLDNIQTAVETIDNAISGTEMQVDVVAALPAGNNNIGNVDIASAIPAGSNNIGDVDIASAIPAGTNVIGDVGISGARTSGGTTLYKNIDVDQTEDQVKATAGQIYWIHCMNLANATRFLKIYNATAASVTVGTTVPDLTFPIPTQGDTNGAGFVLSIPNGIAFGTAITIAATTGVADNDSGAPGANEVVVNLGYA